MRPCNLLLCLLLLVPAACRGRAGVIAPRLLPRHVSLEVEVYDPASNFVWQGVGVRVVEGAMEWSKLTLPNPDPDDWRYTTSAGSVVFGPADLAAADIGFLEDQSGRALLTPDLDEDEAFVLVEVAAPGFPTVRVDVKLTWKQPDVFVSVPFSRL